MIDKRCPIVQSSSSSSPGCLQKMKKRIKKEFVILIGVLVTVININWGFHRLQEHEVQSVKKSLKGFTVRKKAVRSGSFLKRNTTDRQRNWENLKSVVKYDRPPLESIVRGWNITGDASWLLNFSVVGFPKCGTSSIMHLLSKHGEVQIFKDERCEIGFNQHARLIKDLYNQFPPGPYVRGIKCPIDLENVILSLPNYQNFFPKTNFIVGIRHPVLW